MSDQPRISVFITSYNQKALLVEAIDSVLAQTLPAMEIIVVDDASTDGSQQLIHEYAAKHPAIRPFCHPRNLGIGPNKRFAQEQARGDWLTYLDGDDRYLPRKLEKEWDAIQRLAGARIAYSNFAFIDEHGRRTRLWARPGQTMPQGDVFVDVICRDFPYEAVFRNELAWLPAIREVGWYDPTRLTHEDWDLKIRLTRRYRVAYNPDVGMEYRRHSGSISIYAPIDVRLKQLMEVYDRNMPLLEGLPPQVQARVRAAQRREIRLRLFRLLRQARRHEGAAAARRYARQFRAWLDWRSRLATWLPF